MPTVLDTKAEAARGQLESRVESVQQRQRLNFLSTGALAGAAVFTASFLIFSVADILFKLSVGSRLTAMGSMLAGIVVVFYYAVIRPWRKLDNKVQVARKVEHAYPELEEQLSTALEYGRSPELLKASSPELVGALMTHTVKRAEPLDFSRTINWRKLGLVTMVALLLGIGMAWYAKTHSRLFKTTLARFMAPFDASLTPPTLTVITKVMPGNDEVPVEQSVPVAVTLDGRQPETATLSVWIGDEVDGRWEDRPLDRDKDGSYKGNLRRLLENTKYKIKAGDAESAEYKIEVYRTPEITDFVVRLEHPQYTGRGIETLAPGVGDIKALKGSTIHLDVIGNTDLGSAALKFKSGRAKFDGKIDATNPRKAGFSFKVDSDDEYQVHIANTKQKTGAGQLYTIKSLKDRGPRVTIKKPEKDLLVHRDQTVNVEISAEDDIGVREIGIYHSIDVDETKVMVARFDPCGVRAEDKLVWELGNLNLRGGEVIAYYAYVLDNDTVNGPKVAKSDIHFLTVYDEEKYDDMQNPNQPPQQQTPPAVKELDKLIDAQKKLLKETFAQARLRDQNAEKTVSDADKANALKTAEAQKQLAQKVQDLIKKVKAELENGNAEARQDEKKTDGPNPPPQPPAFGEKELKNMESAVDKMATAENKLRIPEANAAVKPETEALRHLSETRRLMLSDKEGDPRFKMAMDKQSKKKKQQEQNQQAQDQQQAKEELAEMPKMMDKQKEIERELEQLEMRKKNNPPPQPGQPETAEQKQEKEEQRKLQRKLQDELQKLAEDAKERARKLEQLAQRNQDMQQSAEKMDSAAQKMEQAAKDAQKQAEQDAQKAKDKTNEARSDVKEAQRSLRNAMDKAVRQELAELKKDAQELAQRQENVGEQASQMQEQQQKSEQGKPEQGKPQQSNQGKPEQGKPEQGAQGKPEQGQPSAQGKPEQGQPQQGNQGKPEQGQPQQSAQGKPEQGQPQQSSAQGKPEQGQSSASGQSAPSSEQKMKAVAGEQAEIQRDLQDLKERIERLQPKAADQKLGGATQLEEARQQAQDNAPATQSAQKAEQALRNKNLADAQKEADKAAKAIEQMAAKLDAAQAATSAGDAKNLAEAMKKAQELAKEQQNINKGLSEKRDPAQLGEREEKVADAAKQLADAAERMEMLRQSGRNQSAKDKLDEAAKQAEASAQALKGQDTAAAKTPAENAEKALNQAVADMERAASKALEDKAREAKSLAKAARENQEKAAATAKDLPADAKDQKNLDAAAKEKRDDAAGKQEDAARDARRLDRALDGLRQLSQDVNPAAAEVAREARETTEKTEAARNMEELSKGLRQIGDPKRAAENKDVKTPTPSEAAKQGEELALVMKNVEKSLDNFIAEATGSQLDRLRALEEAVREASKKAQELAQNSEQQNPDAKNPPNQNDPKNPQGEPKNQDPKDSKNQSNQNTPGQQANNNNQSQTPNQTKSPAGNQAKGEENQQTAEQKMQKLEQELKRLQPKLERLEPNAPEKVKMNEAMAELQKAQEQKNQKGQPGQTAAPSEKNAGGPAFTRVNKALDEVSGALVTRIERLLRAREIRPDEDEDAPKEYRALVDRYYRALSEDVEEDAGKK